MRRWLRRLRQRAMNARLDGWSIESHLRMRRDLASAANNHCGVIRWQDIRYRVTDGGPGLGYVRLMVVQREGKTLWDVLREMAHTVCPCEFIRAHGETPPSDCWRCAADSILRTHGINVWAEGPAAEGSAS